MLQAHQDFQVFIVPARYFWITTVTQQGTGNLPAVARQLDGEANMLLTGYLLLLPYVIITMLLRYVILLAGRFLYASHRTSRRGCRVAVSS